MISITIKECKTNGNKWFSRHRTNDPNEAIQRAIKKHWGASAQWYQDSGLTINPQNTRYGQVGHYVEKLNAATMDTYRLRIDIA